MKKLRQAEKALVDRSAGGNGDVSVTQSTEILLAFELLMVQLISLVSVIDEQKKVVMMKLTLCHTLSSSRNFCVCRF